MPEFKKDFKSLYTAYDNQLQKQNKAGLENFGLDHFITYLKFMRDYYILTEPLISKDGTENIKIATLATAITTYDKYQVCDSLCKTIKNNTENYFKHIIKGKSSDNMWTCFKDYKNQCKGNGYTKGFVNSDCELNKFDNCKNFAYLMNKYPTDLEKENQEYTDLLSIYDLIRIIKYITVDLNHKLNLYVPSKRVRSLLIKWLRE